MIKQKQTQPSNERSSSFLQGYYYYYYFLKIKQSHYRPGRSQRVTGGWGSQISRQSTHEGGNVVIYTHRMPLLPQKIYFVLISVGDWVNPRVIVRPEELFHWKIPMTTSGIEPATFRLVAQCLKQLRHQQRAHISICWCKYFQQANQNSLTGFYSHLSKLFYY